MDIISRDAQITEAIQAELDTISLLFVRGLQELQTMDMNYGSYFMPSQTLSQGLERMMKVILFLSGNIREGQLKRKFSHNLKMLWEELTNKRIVEPIPDPYFEIILSILSEFGHNARYYYISILDGNPVSFNPQDEWEKLESRFLNEDPQRYKMLTNGDDAQRLIKEMVKRLQIPIEMLVNRLSRAIVYYQIREDVWSVPSVIKAFANMSEDSFGNNTYKEWPHCLEIIAKPHKRTWIDCIIRVFHPFRKYQIIFKINYAGNWPFRDVEKVKIEKRMYKRIPLHIITINGYDYALDGRTASLLHIAGIQDTGIAVVGISTQPFLNLAMGL